MDHDFHRALSVCCLMQLREKCFHREVNSLYIFAACICSIVISNDEVAWKA